MNPTFIKAAQDIALLGSLIAADALLIIAQRRLRDHEREVARLRRMNPRQLRDELRFTAEAYVNCATAHHSRNARFAYHHFRKATKMLSEKQDALNRIGIQTYVAMQMLPEEEAAAPFPHIWSEPRTAATEEVLPHV